LVGLQAINDILRVKAYLSAEIYSKEWKNCYASCPVWHWWNSP